jgi:hypothetical protein
MARLQLALTAVLALSAGAAFAAEAPPAERPAAPAPAPGPAPPDPAAAPAPSPSPQPAPAPPAPPETAPAPAPPPPEAAPAPPRFPGPEQMLIDHALQALTFGDLDTAAAALDQAAALATTPEGRTAAVVLADRVRALRAKRGTVQPSRRSPADAEDPPSLSSSLRPRPPARPAEETARPPFLITSTVLGLGVWGWTLPTALGLSPDEDSRAFLGTYMVTAAGAFALPYVLTRQAPPTWGQANMAFYGGTRGIEYGVMLGSLIDGADVASAGGDSRAFATSALLGSVGGLLGGYLWAGAAQLTPGEARTIALLGDVGLFWGFGTGHLLGLDQQDRLFEDRDSDAQARGMAAAGLAGTALGLGSGLWLGRHRHNTWGDGEVMRASAILGAWTGLTGTVLAGEEDSSKTVVATMMIGSGLGAFAGDLLVRNTSFSFGKSILVELAMLAGGLGGAGLTYLVGRTDNPKLYFVAAALGAGAGFGFTYQAYRDDGDDGRASQPPARVGVIPRLGPGGERGLAFAGSF